MLPPLQIALRGARLSKRKTFVNGHLKFLFGDEL